MTTSQSCLKSLDTTTEYIVLFAQVAVNSAPSDKTLCLSCPGTLAELDLGTLGSVGKYSFCVAKLRRFSTDKEAAKL